MPNFQYFSVAVRDLEAGIKRYEEMFGLKQTGEIFEQRWGFRGVMMGNDDGPILELVSPMEQDSALKRFMDMRSGDVYPDGEGLYLVGMEVDDIGEAVKRAQDAGATVTLEEESPTSAWIHPLSNGNVFVEFNQISDDDEEGDG